MWKLNLYVTAAIVALHIDQSVFRVNGLFGLL